MARATGLSHATIGRIWRAFGLQPHRTETFKLSPDPWLVDKVRDIVGLYVNPPEHAVVFCVDEKPQIQALDRTAPLLPMQPGQAERRTTIAATARPRCSPRSTSRPARSSVGRVREVPQAHRRRDAGGAGRTHAQVAPDSAVAGAAPEVPSAFHSDLQLLADLVERWFAELTTRQLRRGVHRPHRGPRAGDSRVSRPAQRYRSPVRVDEIGGADPGEHRPFRATDARGAQRINVSRTIDTGH